MPRIFSEERLSASIKRLLTSPDDLIACGARLVGSATPQTGTVAHRELLASYLTQLRPVAEQALQWWEEAMSYQTAQRGDANAARTALLEEYPAGPAAQGRFVAVVRAYWLRCDALNASLERGQWVDPPKFLLEWVNAAGDDASVEVLASQPYWPICLTKDGQWF